MNTGTWVFVEKMVVRCIYDNPPNWRSVLNRKDKYRYWQYPYPTPYDPSPDLPIVGPHKEVKGYCHWRLQFMGVPGVLIGEVKKQAGQIEKASLDDGGFLGVEGTLTFYEVALPTQNVGRCKIILASREFITTTFVHE